MQHFNAIDLFCGTGGFSRGAHAAGFHVSAGFDIDPKLTFSFVNNFPSTKLFHADISVLKGGDIRRNLGNRHIDLIFGGPPCQGFSSIGRRNANDPRRTLLEHFFRIISELRPSVFVMENVEGLLFKDSIHELENALTRVPEYKIVGPEILNSADFGAATKRRRAFVIGYNPTMCAPIDWSDFAPLKVGPTTVHDSIAGLKSPVRVGEDESGFDVWRLRKNAKRSSYSNSLVSKDGTFTGNRRTVHRSTTIERFSMIKEGGFDPIGKYPRLSWNGQCPTLRAGTGADKGSYQAVRPIHPTEDRVITVREAARLQGFPDCHRFHPTIWHSFRQIGNSVSPVLAKAVLTVIHDKLVDATHLSKTAE